MLATSYCSGRDSEERIKLRLKLKEKAKKKSKTQARVTTKAEISCPSGGYKSDLCSKSN